MEYVIVLDFKSAKFFPLRNNGEMKTTERKDLGRMKISGTDWVTVERNTLYYKHVSNALHVICGQRPVASFRTIQNNNAKLSYDPLCEIINSAKFAKVIVSNVVEVEEIPSNANHYHYTRSTITETIASNKAVIAPAKTPNMITLNGKRQLLDTCIITWDHVRYNLAELWGGFSELIRNVLGIDYFLNMTVVQVFEKMNNYHIENPNGIISEFFIKHANTKIRGEKLKKAYSEIIMNSKATGQHFHSSGYGPVGSFFMNRVNRSPDTVVNLSGKIFIKVDEQIIDMISTYGVSSASLLDGGYVHISEIIPSEDYAWDNNTAMAVPVQLEIK